MESWTAMEILFQNAAQLWYTVLGGPGACLFDTGHLTGLYSEAAEVRMRRLCLVLLAVLLMLPAAAAAEGQNSLIVFSGAWPETLRAVVQNSDYAGFLPTDGILCRADGEWSYGECLMEQGGRRAVAAFSFGDGAWRMSASETALPGGAAPKLWVSAREEEWDEEQIRRFGAGMDFDVIAGERRYTWEHEPDGWMLRRVVLPVASVAVTRNFLLWNEEPVFNMQPVSLTDFRADDFPESLAEARQLASMAEQPDLPEALTVQTGSAPEGTAPIPLYSAPNQGARVIAWCFGGVPAAVADMGSGFVRLEIGRVTGWAPRENVLMGTEQLGTEQTDGAAGWIIGSGTDRYRLLLSLAEPGAEPVASLSILLPVRVSCVLADGGWLQASVGDGTAGFLPVEAVSWQSGRIRSSSPADRVNLRSAADKKSEPVATYYTGIAADLLFSVPAPGWQRAAVMGVPGWISTEFLDRDASRLGEWLPPMASVTRDTPLRSAIGDSQPAVISCGTGTRVEVAGTRGVWAHVRLRTGESGWLPLQYLQGDFSQAVAAQWTIPAGAELATDDGEATVLISADERVTALESRTASQWLYTDGGFAFGEPERIHVQYGIFTGTIPTSSADQGW